jgi:L-histidine Nalpha-methyltransferase
LAKIRGKALGTAAITPTWRRWRDRIAAAGVFQLFSTTFRGVFSFFYTWRVNFAGWVGFAMSVGRVARHLHLLASLSRPPMTPGTLVDFSPAVDNFRADVLAGLSRRPRRLPCKYFYDRRGSELFDRICELGEYYPTRTELSIMRELVAEMAAAIGPRASLIELGSGSSVKTRLLIEGLSDLAEYIPVDISGAHLQGAAARLARDYPELRIAPVCADFTRGIRLPRSLGWYKRVVYFPGSTIGNFGPRPSRRLLARIARLVGPGGGLLVGIDLVKDHDTLARAYNDAAGVTAAFNLNLLARINRELRGTFNRAAFRHRAIYNTAKRRIEMHQVSMREQMVAVDGRQFELAAGETICTEHSHKYTIDHFRALAAPSGLRLSRAWTDPRCWFAVLYFTAHAPGEFNRIERYHGNGIK